MDWRAKLCAARRRGKSIGGAIRSNPSLALIPLTVFAAAAALSVWGVWVWSNTDADATIAATQKQLDGIATSVELTFVQAQLPARQLADLVRHIPDYPTLQGMWDDWIPTWFSWAVGGQALVLLPMGTVGLIYPKVPANTAVLNRTLLGATRRNDTLDVIAGGRMVLSGLTNFAGTAKVVTFAVPIYLGNVTRDETWNIPYTMNTTGCLGCYDAESRTKWWGLSLLALDLNAVLTDSAGKFMLSSLEESGMQYRLQGPVGGTYTTGLTTGSIYESSAEPMSDSNLCRSIKLTTSLKWELCVWVDSWHPTFTKPVMAAMVLISFLLAGAVFAVLLSRHENMALLHSLLPKSTINKLHANFQWTSGASAMLLESGTPAELMLQVVEDILSDKPPDLAKVMMVRSALQQSLDIYKPLADDLSVRLAQVKYVDSEVREALMAQLMGRRPKSETGCEGEDPIGLNADPVPDVLDELDELDEVPDRPSEHPDSYPAPVVQVLSRVIAAEQPVDADVAPALQASSDAVAKDQPLAVSVLDPEPPTPAEPQFMLTLRPTSKESRRRPDQALPAMLSLQTASSTPGAQYHSTGNVQRAALENSLAEQPATLAFVGELVGRELDRIAPSTLTTMLRRIMAQRLPELQPPGSGIALLAAATQLQLKPLQGGSDGDVPLKAKPGHRGPDWETAQPPTLKPAPMREVEACLAAAHSWEFDAFQLTAVTGGRPLSVLAYWLLQKTGLVSAIRLDPAKLARWLCRIEAGYCSNAYHNRSHAADVVQTLHMLLTQGGLAPGYADPLTQLAAYLAAVCHDYQHLGRTNDWLIETRDELALRYNDRSPMENHHLAAAFSLLKDPELNFLALLPKASWERLRKLMVELVLGTDMKQHFSIIGAFTALHRLNTSEAQGSARISGAGKQESLPSYGKASSSTVDELQPVSEQDKLLSLQMALKCSDLGHLAAPLPVHLAWVARLEAEFFAQGDAERAQGLAISPLCDRTKQGITKSQVGFFDFVALPLFKNFTARFTAAKPLLHGVLRNYAHWQAQAADS